MTDRPRWWDSRHLSPAGKFCRAADGFCRAAFHCLHRQLTPSKDPMRRGCTDARARSRSNPPLDRPDDRPRIRRLRDRGAAWSFRAHRASSCGPFPRARRSRSSALVLDRARQRLLRGGETRDRGAQTRASRLGRGILESDLGSVASQEARAFDANHPSLGAIGTGPGVGRSAPAGIRPRVESARGLADGRGGPDDAR